MAISQRVPSPTVGAWTLETNEAVKVILKKRNWSAPGADRVDCHRRKRNLSVAWVDVRKAYDSVDHRWLNEIMLVHRFPVWICEFLRKVCAAWNTRIVANTRVGNVTFPVISFNRGISQGDALCLRLFTLCLNPVAWKLCSTEDYRLSRPVGSKVANLLYIDDLKVFAASQA